MAIFLENRQSSASSSIGLGRFSSPSGLVESTQETFGIPNVPGMGWYPIGITGVSLATIAKLPVGTYNLWLRIGGVDVSGPITLSNITGQGSGTVTGSTTAPTDPLGADLDAKKLSIRILNTSNPTRRASQVFAYKPTDNSATQVYGTHEDGLFDNLTVSPAFFWFFSPFTGGGAGGVPDISCQTPWPVAGTFSNLITVTNFSTTPNDATVSFALRKNGVDTLLSTSMPNDQALRVNFDNTHSISVMAGDLLNWRASTTGATGTNARRVDVFCFVQFISS